MEKWIDFSDEELEILLDVFDFRREEGFVLSVPALNIYRLLTNELNERILHREEEAEREKFRNK